MTPLRKRMLEDLQIRNYSPNTVAAYIRRVAEFAKHFGKSPELLGPEEIREYQLYLIKEKGVSLSAYIQTVCGLRFLYSNTLHRSVSIDRIPLPRYEKKLPVILSPAEVQRLLETPKNLSHRTILTTMYAAGPRVSEVAMLKPPDIDSGRGVIWIRGAETLLTIAADPQHLGAAIGLLAVLHSWGQTLHSAGWGNQPRQLAMDPLSK